MSPFHLPIGYTLERMIDRYIHLHKTQEFDESNFATIYQNWEIAVFNDQLIFEIVIPLLMITCTFERFCALRMTCASKECRSHSS